MLEMEDLELTVYLGLTVFGAAVGAIFTILFNIVKEKMAEPAELNRLRGEWFAHFYSISEEENVAYSGDGDQSFRFHRDHSSLTHWTSLCFTLSDPDGSTQIVVFASILLLN